MFTLKNLRKEKKDGWTRIVVDFEVTGGKKPFGYQDTLWFAVENKNANMLADDVYDAFAPFILYLGMINHQDVHIEGKMSPLLYHNLTHYVAAIFKSFSERARRIEFVVDGLKEAKKVDANLVGTGFSCGVDSLNTVYDNFVKAGDGCFKVNCLFYFNCGQHGAYTNKNTKRLWDKRTELHQRAQKELGLQAYRIDSNLHAFYTYPTEFPACHGVYLGVFGCILSVQRKLRRYVVANSMTYDELLEYGKMYRDDDLFGFADSYLVHLFSTEALDISIDGCEFTRAEKLERMQDWDIANKYLDVCIDLDGDGRNCSKCAKCIRTLLLLDTMGILNNFRESFDLDVYRSSKKAGVLELALANHGLNGAVIEYMKNHGAYVPPKILAVPEYFLLRVKRKLGRIFNGKIDSRGGV